MVVLAKSRKSENNGFLVLNHKSETSKTSVFVVCRFLIFCVSAKSASKNAVFFHVHESEEKGTRLQHEQGYRILVAKIVTKKVSVLRANWQYFAILRPIDSGGTQVRQT